MTYQPTAEEVVAEEAFQQHLVVRPNIPMAQLERLVNACAVAAQTEDA